ncbi:MAG TPA: hypothetical protein VNM67_25500 [Thermoanaerobaculia bacterium]|jgi:hypothetical protein|nr:hypothetical protein [Thermoanaerobaculia bacterium]
MGQPTKIARPAKRAVVSLCLLFFLFACGTETQPRLTDAGPRPAKITSRSTERLGASGALLVATGRQSFEGALPVRCAVHEETGLQVNLRTGDPDLPAVAVRVDEISDIRGGGPYRGELFVTGRSRTGALASSTGQVSLELEDGGSASGPIVLKGSFDGTYEGMAGKGSVEGRFRGCSLPALSR